jgi:hypothetical protein
MRRLSQKAWNNVLIFAMLILIVIFNYERLFPVNEQGARLIVGENQFILSVQINVLTFERIGTGWRVSAPSEDDLPSMRSEDIDVLIGQWQRAMLKPTNDELAANVTANPDHIVSIWVAGEKSPQVLGLLKANNNAYAIYNGDLYLLDFPTLNQLLPPSD